MNADTMPTRIVTSMPMGCLPGRTSLPSTPTTAPMKMAVMMPVMVIASSRGGVVEEQYPAVRPEINTDVNPSAARRLAGVDSEVLDVDTARRRTVDLTGCGAGVLRGSW